VVEFARLDPDLQANIGGWESFSSYLKAVFFPHCSAHTSCLPFLASGPRCAKARLDSQLVLEEWLHQCGRPVTASCPDPEALNPNSRCHPLQATHTFQAAAKSEPPFANLHLRHRPIPKAACRNFTTADRCLKARVRPQARLTDVLCQAGPAR